MGHNVLMHLTAVQEANRRFDAGEHPAMMQRSTGDYAKFEDIVEAIFAAPDRASAEAIIESYNSYWMEIVGTRGFKGKKTKNANTMFNALFEVVDEEPEETERDEKMAEDSAETRLGQLVRDEHGGD
jgi:erythromycin esterase-like protein